jgi:hypothetical protein
MYNDVIAFANSLNTGTNPGEIFNRDIGRFYEGRYSTFQILGAFMCDHIVRQLGNPALMHCITNPLEFHEQFEVSLKQHPDHALFDGNSFSSIFSERERRAQPLRKAKRTIVKYLDNGAAIIAFERPVAPGFCLLFRGAGSMADHAGAGGLAHLVEHRVINCMGKDHHNIDYLKGFTDYLDCRYLATIKTHDYTRLKEVLERALQPLPDDEDEFKKVRGEVTAELEFVSRNPFYLAENMLMRMMIPGTSAVRGDLSELNLLEQEDSMMFHRRHYRPSRAVLAVQAADPERIIDQAGFLGDWPENSDDNCPPACHSKPEDSIERTGWIKCPYPITTCSLGFKVDSGLASEMVSDYIVNRLIYQNVKRHLRDIIHEKKVAIISGYKCMEGCGALTIGIQTRESDIVEIMDRVLNHLYRTDFSSDIDRVFHSGNGVETLIERIWGDSEHGLLELSAKSEAGQDMSYLNDECSLRDELAVTCRDFGTSLAQAIIPDGLWMAGIGPMEINRF